MKKILLSFIICFLSFFVYLNNTNALAGYTTGTLINVRTEPNTNGANIGQIKDQNTTIELVSNDLYNQGDPNCSIGWYKINYNGKEGYVCGSWVSIGTPGDTNIDFSTSNYQARVTDTLVSVRNGPGYTRYSAIATLAPGTNVVIQDKVAATDSRCQEGWYKVKYYKGETGYICSLYVSTKEELTASDASYEATLRSKGFPETYIPYLVKLHQLHPNWTFNPVITNLNWQNVVSSESSQNYISGTYLNSTVNNLYQKWPSNESGWYVATDGVNAYYLDPRNFLTEKFIFMFEDLHYNYGTEGKRVLDRNSAITKEYYNTISNIFGSGSYMNNEEYIYYFIEAGYEANVSPVYLASLAKQEVTSTDQTVGSISGSYSQSYINALGVTMPLTGLYNYYNIRAFWSGNNAPITMGLAYACGLECGFDNSYGRPWNTREKAIKGGALWIADGYISENQHTIYFKKFNTHPNSGYNKFTHQYQTNVTAPTSESVTTYEAYKEQNLLNSAFVFDIPIYLNMPDVVSLPDIASTDNLLNKITINGNPISSYDKDVLEHTVYITNDISSVNISVEKSDINAKVTGTGTIMTTNEITEHQIIVTAENGNVRTYRITIKKVADSTTVDQILSKLSVKISGKTMNNISPETTSNTLIQSILKNSPTASVTIYNASGKAINGSSLLETGGSIRITAPSGETKNYTLAVTGDTNGDGVVTLFDLLQIQKHLVGTTKLSEIASIAADVDKDGNITLFDLLQVQKYIKKEITL